ncbi:MAG: hypothetical protein AB1641_01845 [Thermodesulfobacteriota bacterium]
MVPEFIRYGKEFQRIGLLKILVAVLDPQRRSAASEQINRKFLQILAEEKSVEMTKAQQLLRDADNPSWNFYFTRATVGQILEWGKLIGFVGSGNQITESGLLLRSIMSERAISSIVKGNSEINPFHLTLEEKLYFLYRHLEADTPLYFLIKKLATIPDGPISGISGDRLVCFALFDTYKMISERHGYSSFSLVTLKNLRGLIGKMVGELDLESEIPIRLPAQPVPLSILKARPEQRHKKRTKTSDHEAIPRLEFLTDIGFLVKRPDEGQNEDIEIARKAWRYWVTPLLIEFSKKLPDTFAVDFYWIQFAGAAAAFLNGDVRRLQSGSDSVEIARRAYSSYAEVKRSFGHTPVESVAVLAMIRSLAGSDILEVKDVHELFLGYKQNNILPETVRFAAGNELDKMFIYIKPSFISDLEKLYGDKQ